MKLPRRLTAALVLTALAAGSFAVAADKKAAPAEAELVAKARAAYPLKTCLVSGESLGSMGEAAPYIHRVKGQPDRIVFVCCEGCIDDFKADPAKFLKKVDDAAKAQAAAKKS